MGAAPCGQGICIFIRSEGAYEGKLEFDIPRHRLYMGFEQDWPRMNAVPEWFTVEPDEEHAYEIEDVDRGTIKVVTGASLREGLPVALEPGKPLRLMVRPR